MQSCSFLINLNKTDTFLSPPFVTGCAANVHKGCKEAAPPCPKVTTVICARACFYLAWSRHMICLGCDSSVIV